MWTACRCEQSAERLRGSDPLVIGPVSTEKGVPGDGDALLIDYKDCEFSECLLRDGPTRNAIASISRRIRFHVVRFRMHNQRSSTITEYRVVVAGQTDVLVRDRGLGRAVRSYREVLHIAGVVTFRIFQAVLLAVGIQVSAC